MPVSMPPRHIAIIMDGNGRWAEQRGFGRTWGHRHGAKRVDEIVTACCELGVTHLTLYAFSTENWNRPSGEVNLLMRLLVRQLKSMDKKLVRNRVALVAQGQLERLPPFVQSELARVSKATHLDNPALRLCLSLSYGGRQELVDGIKEIAGKVERGQLRLDQIDESLVRAHLYRPEFPDPDLLIRTGGEYRISNFLLWQIAYSELYITAKLWPDFRKPDLEQAIEEFACRERRFGKTSAQVIKPLDPPKENPGAQA